MPTIPSTIIPQTKIGIKVTLPAASVSAIDFIRSRGELLVTGQHGDGPLDDGSHPLAEPLVRFAGDERVEDGRVRLERLLYLLREDLLPA